MIAREIIAVEVFLLITHHSHVSSSRISLFITGQRIQQITHVQFHFLISFAHNHFCFAIRSVFGCLIPMSYGGVVCVVASHSLFLSLFLHRSKHTHISHHLAFCFFCFFFLFCSVVGLPRTHSPSFTILLCNGTSQSMLSHHLVS